MTATLNMRVAALEHAVAVLKGSDDLITADVGLLIAAKMARDSMREFYRIHKREIDTEGEDDQDYKEVVAPLSVLEKAIELAEKGK